MTHQCQIVPSGQIEECGKVAKRTRDIVGEDGAVYRVWLCERDHPLGNVKTGSSELVSMGAG